MRRTVCVIALLASTLMLSAAAEAKGPCPRCIEPSTARVDSKLRVDHRTAFAVWNPQPRLLADEQKQLHTPDSPSVVLYDGIPQPGFVFRAPDAEPGRYLVALFDEIGGGGRYTWDFVTLEAGLPEEAADDGLPGWAIGLAIGAGVLIAGAAALALRYKQR